MNAPMPLIAALQLEIAHASQVGLRSANEDYVGATLPEGELLRSKGALLAIADGVGGHAKGREAAEHTVRSLLIDYYATPDTWGAAKALDTVLAATNRWLTGRSRQAQDAAGMATTLTCVVLRGTRYHLGHVGDSRAYLLRDGVLTQLTEDHTWQHPELNNVLRRAIGLDAHLVIDHADGELQTGDRFLLVTDGIWNTLSDVELASTLNENPIADDAASALALAAVRRGASDNCTALVANVLALPQTNLRDRLDASLALPLPPRLKKGQEIDGLIVLELLHASRMTMLYKVIPAAGGERMVLKTLCPEADDEQSLAALVHEEWLARRVLGPSFPQVISHPERSRLYYLMTWHEGESLGQRLKRGHQYSAPEVAEIGMRLLRAIASLHRLQIIHRDIKPDNIQLGQNGQITVLDLGVAASDGQRFAEINNPGTPSYMAPELFANSAASEASDLYACGVTLYELLTRKYPYGEIEPFQNPRFGQPTPPTRHRPDVPDWLEAILLKACARLPKERFETAEEFLLALERGAHRPLATPRRVPLLQRNPTLSLKAVLIASLLVNLLLMVALMRH